jgi:CopG family transcriptional regulator/antitoxin EndoAI
MAKVMISLPERFLKRVDRLARAQHRSRSEMIREALRSLMSRRATSRQSWKDALAPLRELEEQWIGQWDSTDIIRYYRDARYGRTDRR